MTSRGVLPRARVGRPVVGTKLESADWPDSLADSSPEVGPDRRLRLALVALALFASVWASRCSHRRSGLSVVGLSAAANAPPLFCRLSGVPVETERRLVATRCPSSVRVLVRRVRAGAGSSAADDTTRLLVRGAAPVEGNVTVSSWLRSRSRPCSRPERLELASERDDVELGNAALSGRRACGASSGGPALDSRRARDRSSGASARSIACGR